MTAKHQYYEEMRALANKVRGQYGLSGPRVLKSDFRRIYKQEGIKLDYWDHPLKKLRGAYFNDELGVSVMISKTLPDDPLIFTLGHELKHHLVDSARPTLECSAGNSEDLIEIGAEVFSAEMLFPDALFVSLMEAMGVKPGECKAEALVRLKHETKTTLSYQGLVKKVERLGFAKKDAIKQGGWRKLEEQIYGINYFRRRRASSTKN